MIRFFLRPYRRWVVRRELPVCWFRGHDDITHFGAGRIYIRCQTCGRETPGWRLKTNV